MGSRHARRRGAGLRVRRRDRRGGRVGDVRADSAHDPAGTVRPAERPWSVTFVDARRSSSAWGLASRYSWTGSPTEHCAGRARCCARVEHLAVPSDSGSTGEHLAHVPEPAELDRYAALYFEAARHRDAIAELGAPLIRRTAFDGDLFDLEAVRRPPARVGPSRHSGTASGMAPRSWPRWSIGPTARRPASSERSRPSTGARGATPNASRRPLRSARRARR